MAQKLKSQDLMEIFNEKLDRATEKFDLNEKISRILDEKLNEISKTSVNIELKPLIQINNNITEIFENHIVRLMKISNEHQEKIKISVKKEVKYQLYFYCSLTVLFSLCTGFLLFGIDQYHKKTFAEKEKKFYSKEAYRRNDYLKEKNLTEKYEFWLESKQK